MRAVVGLIRRLALLSLVLAACGDPAARVRLEPIDLGACGKPSVGEVTRFEVIAYGAAMETPKTIPVTATGAVALSDFPGDTQQLGLQLYGASGVIAAGKTAPLDFGGLADGTAIPIAMAPLGGFCRVGDLAEARANPLVARADGGVLVLGGTDPGGMPLATAEYYDASTALFAPVAMPPEIVDIGDFAGGVLTTLPDGRVALTGTASHVLAIFDPKTKKFGSPSLTDPRAFHGAIAPASDRLFLIGGCINVVGDACGPPPLHTAFTYHLDDLTRDLGPQLPDTAARVGAALFDLGVQSDGAHRYALAGGSGDAGAGDRFAMTDAQTKTFTGLGAQVAALDGGALLSAFAPDGATASGASFQLAPEAMAASSVALAPALAGARLITLEDGSVLAVGGSAAGDVARYQPTVNAWQAGPPSAEAGGAATGALTAPALARLPDGSVLVLGSAPAAATAWIFRPSLVGPNSGRVVVEPGNADPGVITALDPTTASHGGSTFSLTGDPALAFVGGARTSTGSVNAAVRVTGDHLELIGQALGPGRMLIGELYAGNPARIARVDGGTVKTSCTGQTVPAFDKNSSTPVGLAVAGTTATLSLGGMPIATCSLASDPDASDQGSWGIAALGGTQVDVATITVSR
jgi:hypothetical protein